MEYKIKNKKWKSEKIGKINKKKISKSRKTIERKKKIKTYERITLTFDLSFSHHSFAYIGLKKRLEK